MNSIPPDWKFINLEGTNIEEWKKTMIDAGLLGLQGFEVPEEDELIW